MRLAMCTKGLQHLRDVVGGIADSLDFGRFYFGCEVGLRLGLEDDTTWRLVCDGIPSPSLISDLIAPH